MSVGDGLVKELGVTEAFFLHTIPGFNGGRR